MCMLYVLIVSYMVYNSDTFLFNFFMYLLFFENSTSFTPNRQSPQSEDRRKNITSHTTGT
ncbi:hypothetical protein HanRHA438_Chr06g0285681 [Helianthus annuus]|nr:hypothetical protein HanIR_Chr06g0297481 [Helianthus annuus]KAJ0913448.1 hypothetical protein HanRHA438_Chr06g0285681 [Helianthus annuus]